MSTFPNFSNFPDHITKKLNGRKGKTMDVSKLNCWIRLTSGTGPNGLVLVSNPNIKLFQAAGETGVGIYGTDTQSGVIGKTWKGATVTSTTGQGFKPSPVVTSLEIDEGAGNLSRKASFSITAFSKEQMESVSKYFLEPGFSIFIEWGWNTPKGVSGKLDELTAGTISKYQSFSDVNTLRKKADAEYDNYLGFMTGGSVSLDGDKWTISVKASGYTELPAYLMSSENLQNPTGSLDNGGNISTLYGVNAMELAGESNVGIERWMRVFNELPQTRQTNQVKELESKVGKQENFVNWEADVINAINDSFDGAFFGLRDSRQTVDGDEVQFPSATKVVDENNRYIRFGTLMDIFNEIGAKGYKIGGENGKLIKFEVDTNDTWVSAFKHIFSIDSSKMFIPNLNTPKLSLGNITDKTSIKDIINTKNPVDCRVSTVDGKFIQFPETIKSKKATENLKREAYTFGFLKNLYVHFDFAKSVLETENFFVKDALYQILNGMSSAVNGMWDFQIVEHQKGVVGSKDDPPYTQLQVVELNNISMESSNVDDVYQFDLIGSNSIFIDASLDLDISGMKMNQIIGQRLGRTINESSNRIPSGGQLFSKQKDLLELSLQSTTQSTNQSGGSGTPTPPKPERAKSKEEEKQQKRIDDAEAGLAQALRYEPGDMKVTIEGYGTKQRQQHINYFNGVKNNATNRLRNATKNADDAAAQAKKEDKEDAKNDNLAVALGKLKLVPNVTITVNEKSWIDKLKETVKQAFGAQNTPLYSECYVAAIEDKTLFTQLRHNFNVEEIKRNTVSPLMPINFSFTIHGISGMQRGDKFKVNGIPKQYSTGFFQVISVKHTISGMLWKTEITGGYRNT